MRAGFFDDNRKVSDIFMTNEELAIAWQTASLSERQLLITQLWEQNRGLLFKLAYRFFVLYGNQCSRAGVTIEDLKQTTFFVLHDAVESYRPEQGLRFVTFLKWPAQNRFWEATGMRGRQDMLNHCTSLDAPIGDDDGDTLGDITADPRQTELLEQVDQQLFEQGRRQAIESCLAELTLEQQRVIRLRYYENLSGPQAGERMGLAHKDIRSIESKALRALCHPSRLRRLQAYHDEIRNRHAWYSTGLAAWRNSGASSVELATERADGETRRRAQEEQLFVPWQEPDKT